MYNPATWVHVLTDVNLDSYSLFFFCHGGLPCPFAFKKYLGVPCAVSYLACHSMYVLFCMLLCHRWLKLEKKKPSLHQGLVHLYKKMYCKLSAYNSSVILLKKGDSSVWKHVPHLYVVIFLYIFLHLLFQNLTRGVFCSMLRLFFLTQADLFL